MIKMRVASLAASAVLVLTSTAFAVKPSVNAEDVPQIHRVAGAKLLSSLQSRMKGAGDDTKLSVIVTCKNVGKAHKLKINATHRYTNIPLVSAELTPTEINNLAQNRDVTQIEYNEQVQEIGLRGPQAKANQAKPGLNATKNANYWYGIQSAVANFKVTGNGDGDASTFTKADNTIAIVDSGIDPKHVDLAGKVIGWTDLVNNKTTPYDDRGHGTAVSSVAAGLGVGNPNNIGVAPGSALVGVKILNASGASNVNLVAQGIDWVISNQAQYGIRVMNLAVGGAPGDGTDAISLAVNRAYEAGIVVCAAAGNAGPASGNVGTPGIATGALSVGAMRDPSQGGFILLDSSSRGPTTDGRIKPDILGPGYQIPVALYNSGNQYVTSYSGTVLSSAFVSGTAALMCAAKPSVTATQVVSQIQSTATDWGPAGKDNDYGSGNLNGYNAIKLAGGFCNCSPGPLLPTHIYQAGTITSAAPTQKYTIAVTAGQVVSIAMIMPSWTSGNNHTLSLLSPTGSAVSTVVGTTRQNSLVYAATATGNYTISVSSNKGTIGAYFFDANIN